MDPESVAFQPHDDFWRFQSQMLRVQQNQAEISERLSRLERKHEEDSRLKNVWGTSSPFPAPLGPAAQQVSLQQPTAEHFAHFDGQSTNLIGNLQLDADEEPRRIGATSRANSVRFDETANPGHWAHASRSSLDLIPRTGSGMGGHVMSERSYSHKSDGRQSSAGQSVHSTTSGRANSLTSFGPINSIGPPGLAPGLFILGPVPAIIRCWLNTDFKHDALLYAAVCSGIYTSCLNYHVVERLGFQNQIIVDDQGSRSIKLPVYLPEAVPVSASSRSESPAPHLPSIVVDFSIIEEHHADADTKAIQIFLGSDMLREHHADVLFSSNQLTLYDDDRSKLQIPLVRPEDERAFKSLSVTYSSRAPAQSRNRSDSVPLSVPQDVTIKNSIGACEPSMPAAILNIDGNVGELDKSDLGDDSSLCLGLTTASRAETNTKDTHNGDAAGVTQQLGAASTTWSNWRRESVEKTNASSLDWASIGRSIGSGLSHERRDTGMKVLKPSKPLRSMQTSTLTAGGGQSRFFDEGKQRSEGEVSGGAAVNAAKRTMAAEKTKDTAPAPGKQRVANPVGGASAFVWLNSGGSNYDDERKRPDAIVCLINKAILGRTTSAQLRRRRRPLPPPPLCPFVCLEAPRASRQAPSFTTASTKKRKTAQDLPRDDNAPQSPNVAAVVASPRASPHPSVSPPRYLPPHLHDEVLITDSHDTSSSSARDSYAGASSPSEAYANLTLNSREGSMTELDSTQADSQQQPRRPPRSSSPAKRLHSDMDDSPADYDAAASNSSRTNGQSSPRATKPLPAASGASQRSARATSVEMADAPNSGSSETDASNADSSATSIDASQHPDLPSVDEQVARVMTMMGGDLKDGQEGYIISEKWLERVWARTSENINRPQDFNKEATQGPIGPVDNEGLVDLDTLQDDLADQHGEDFIPLSKGVQMGQDFEILPAKAWELVISWYGLKEGSPVIRRYAHNTVPDKSSENIIYELFPPILTVRKVRKAPLTAADNARSAEKIVASRHESLLSFLEAVKKASGIDLSNKVRIWRILKNPTTDLPQTPQPSGILTPDASPREPSPSSNQRSSLVMDVATFNGLAPGTERELVTSGNEKAALTFNDTLTLADAGLAQDQIIVLEEHDEKGEYLSDMSKILSKNKPGSQINKGIQSSSNSGRNSPALGAQTRGRTRNGKVRGQVGLTNLGNTCYMNSALQCLRSVEELSMYFLNKKWADEVNASNPIGHKGAIAKVYAQLLTQIYDVGNVSSFAPKNFKQTLGRENNLFSGYGQQDSQEFVSWLVDALHEDLNRVHEKPYRENPDSDDNTFRDPEAIKKLGEIYRDNHRARNDSVATDLFSGFYKNTMVCPVCDKVSITFDPYSQLTLQLPIEQSWTHTVTYIPLHSKPFQLEVDIDKNATIKALKEYVGKRGGGVPANRLMASEVYSHKFYRHLDDKSTIAESNIGIRDDIYFYELDHVPSNWPAPKKKGSRYKAYSLLHDSSDEEIPDSASPLHDRIMIPVFHRGPSVSSYRAQNFSLSLWPFHIVLTREEAKDYDTILRKVLAKVAQATTRPILSELSTPSLGQSGSSSDVVLTTEEDSSPNDPQVNDGSIEGEDMVEVTMTDPVESTGRIEPDEIPEVLQPGSYIHPEFRQLFELKHIRKSNEIVTTGWSTVDHSRALEPISKRIRIPPSREESVQSSPTGSDGSSSDEDAPSQLADADAAIEAANVSSDEEMETVESETAPFARGGRANKKKSKKQRKQERKQERKHRNNKNFRKNKIPEQPSYPDGSDNQDDDSLIRMGEALVLEWNPDAYDALFGGSSEEDPRGQDALKFVETLEDSEIQEKKVKRASRRKHGITLEECFTESSKSEVLSEDNAWYCNRCKELRRATKTLDIWTVPDILIIHLKRFSGHRSFRDKIEELVDFPVEGLDLAGKVGFPEGKDQMYDLFAVDNHFGGLGGGHYTATAQNFFDQQWYDYNDSIVSPCVSGQKAVTRAAYLLFYRRRSPHPLGPPSLQQVVVADTNPDSEDDADADGPRSQSPAGNGLRLGDSSHNGSSSAGGVVVGVGALRGGGSLLSAAESRLKNVAGAESLNEDDVDMPPPAYDEGFVDSEEPEYLSEMYGPLNRYGSDTPLWSFDTLSHGRGMDHEFDDAASDAPNPGSTGTEDFSNRLAEEFGEDDLGPRPGVSTPTEGIQATLGPSEDGDDDVAEIRLRNN